MTARILDPAFRYMPSASHDDPHAFRERMAAYAKLLPQSAPKPFDNPYRAMQADELARLHAAMGLQSYVARDNEDLRSALCGMYATPANTFRIVGEIEPARRPINDEPDQPW